MKQNVIEFFQNLPAEKSEQFNQAFELYRKSPTKNSGVERSLNAQGFSERTLENLLYDLQKMYGITDVEKVKVIDLPAKDDGLSEGYQKYLEVKANVLAIDSLHDLFKWSEKRQEEFNDMDELLGFAIEDNDSEILEDLISACQYLEIDTSEKENVKKLLEVRSNEKWDDLDRDTKILFRMLLDANDEDLKDYPRITELEDVEIQNLIETADNAGLIRVSDKIKAILTYNINVIDPVVVTDVTIPLREEFPFLNDKDCPNELKILVADKITAWKTYEVNHAKLLQIESGELVVPGEEQAEIAKAAVTAFAENQAIYDELNAYKETGKVLGVHPIFRTLQMQREVDAMDQAELIAYKGASAKYFSTNKKDLEKAETAKNDAKIEEITARVAVRKEMLALVNKKLGIPSK
jgi:hypothetical protein